MNTSADWKAHLEALETAPAKAERVTDLAPGFYVSAQNDAGQRVLVEGPYTHHAEALVRVWPVSQAWADVDPRSCWYAWGTAKVRS